MRRSMVLLLSHRVEWQIAIHRSVPSATSIYGGFKGQFRARLSVASQHNAQSATATCEAMHWALKKFLFKPIKLHCSTETKGMTMRKALLCLAIAGGLAGCGDVKPANKEAYRVQVTYTLFGYPRRSETVNFTPDGRDITYLAFSGRDGSDPIDKNGTSFHTIWIQPDPRSYDQIRGTDLFHDIRLNINFSLGNGRDGLHVLHFSGPMDYMSSQEFQNCVGINCVGGTVAKHLDVQGDISLVQDVPATYELPNGLKMSLVLVPDSRFSFPQTR